MGLLGDLLGGLGEAMTKSTRLGYDLGKQAGEEGLSDGYYEYQDAGYPQAWLAAYRDGYNEGRRRRRSDR